jgi:hypothetical protein
MMSVANNMRKPRPGAGNFRFGANLRKNAEPERYGSSPAPAQGDFAVEEKLTSLFEPDTLASAQYFDNLRRKTILEPEKRLILAILEDAINSFQDNVSAVTSKGKKLFKETEEWVLEQDGDWIFSFRSVCEILGLNPEYVRRGLLRWKQKKLAGQLGPKPWEAARMVG